MLKLLNKWKSEVITIASVMFVIYWVDAPRSISSENKEHLEKIDILLSQMYTDIKNNEGKLEGFLIGLNINPENAKKWSKMPKEPAVDSLGNPIVGAEWVRISDDVQLGVSYKFQKSDSGVTEILIDTLWNVSEK